MKIVDLLEPNAAKCATQLKAKFFPKYSQITTLETGIWEVESGIVKLSTIHDDGLEVVIGWAYPGAFFGKYFSYGDTYQAKALSDVYLKYHPIEDIEHSPFLSKKVLSQTIQQMRQSNALSALAGTKFSEQ